MNNRTIYEVRRGGVGVQQSAAEPPAVCLFLIRNALSISPSAAGLSPAHPETPGSVTPPRDGFTLIEVLADYPSGFSRIILISGSSTANAPDCIQRAILLYHASPLHREVDHAIS